MELTELTLRIFSVLERQWLVHDVGDGSFKFPPPQQQRRKTRILSIDGGCGFPALATALASLVHLEQLLQAATGDPEARIADFFDIVAGTGTGGVLAVLLTASTERRGPLSARAAAELLRIDLPEKLRWSIFRRRRRRRMFSARSLETILRAALGSLTLRDTVKPLLVPCYDLLSGAPFVFSGAGAGESPALDFELWKVCRATSATPGLFEPFHVASVDGATVCQAVDGGLAISNPASAAVTHVLHNKADFPSVGRVEDLILLSLGSGGERRSRRWPPRVAEMEIVMEGLSDAVDQILVNAFPGNADGYLRIQVNDSPGAAEEEKGKLTEEGLRRLGERIMRERGVESLPLGGKRLSALTNGERMEEFVRRWLLRSGTTAAEQRNKSDAGGGAKP
ncbi:unnamed protein product [Spirodela intermedia]|uniref:Patatin n=1 Tax=Spirodela intermedia TaxID=51605 RepID=A0A7I8JFQ3_SPIIN|nr:unnamed protein product [Spirodela intermedia]CAA6668967.1 unnamed protein product [Spirodela intermedia]